MSDLTGQVLAEHYQVGERIGETAWWQTYRAVTVAGGRPAVLKVLACDPQAAARLAAKARALAAVQHANLAAIEEVGECGAGPYCARAWLPGSDLRSEIACRGQLPRADVLAVLANVAGGLACLHSQGLVHGAVKCANVLLDGQGRAVLADFGPDKLETPAAQGLAAASGSPPGGCPDAGIPASAGPSGATAPPPGSGEYLAPEQLQGQPATPGSDLYALGIVAYAMITGRVPFRHEDAMVTAMLHLNQRPPDPRQFRPGLPDEVAALLQAALAKQAAERPPDAVSFVEGLRQAWPEGCGDSQPAGAAGEPDGAPPAGDPEAPAATDAAVDWQAAGGEAAAEGKAATVAAPGDREPGPAARRRPGLLWLYYAGIAAAILVLCLVFCRISVQAP